MVPSEWSGSADERLVRMKQALRRVSNQCGQEEVARRLSQYEPQTPEEWITLARLRKAMN